MSVESTKKDTPYLKPWQPHWLFRTTVIVNSNNKILGPYLSSVLDQHNTFRNVVRLAVAEVQADGDGNLKRKTTNRQSGRVLALACVRKQNLTICRIYPLYGRAITTSTHPWALAEPDHINQPFLQYYSRGQQPLRHTSEEGMMPQLVVPHRDQPPVPYTHTIPGFTVSSVHDGGTTGLPSGSHYIWPGNPYSRHCCTCRVGRRALTGTLKPPAFGPSKTLNRMTSS